MQLRGDDVQASKGQFRRRGLAPSSGSRIKHVCYNKCNAGNGPRFTKYGELHTQERNF
jgi:hypothetical protein